MLDADSRIAFNGRLVGCCYMFVRRHISLFVTYMSVGSAYTEAVDTDSFLSVLGPRGGLNWNFESPFLEGNCRIR
jgi:hypothetical protein